MKKKYLALVLALGVVAVAGVGGSLAARSDESAKITEVISEKTLGVAEKSNIQTDIKANPGADVDLNYSVVNDGGENNSNGSYDIYTKVYVYYGFDDVDNDGDSPVKFFLNDNGNKIELKDYITSYDEQYSIGKWIIAYYDDEQIVMYYTSPLKEGEQSTEFLSSMSFETTMGNEYSQKNFYIDTSVDAVQKNMAESAIAAEWGVYPQFDADGNITYVSEVDESR